MGDRLKNDYALQMVARNALQGISVLLNAIHTRLSQKEPAIEHLIYCHGDSVECVMYVDEESSEELSVSAHQSEELHEVVASRSILDLVVEHCCDYLDETKQQECAKQLHYEVMQMLEKKSGQ